MSDHSEALKSLPSIDRLLAAPQAQALLVSYGHDATVATLRVACAEVRQAILAGDQARAPNVDRLLAAATARLEVQYAASMKPVFNLTGTVLHTNLGRALLPAVALEAMVEAAAAPTNLEYDLKSARRGDRDSHVEDWLCRLTGAEAATIVNNNAAAVLLILNTFARRREVVVSRGELVEIGGSFRIPDVMSRAGAKLVEVGTTNRTHPEDFATAISERTAFIMKVHTSNYVVEGFTAEVAAAELARISHEQGVPLVIDLGSGTLIDLTQYGLPPEPTVAQTIRDGADIVCFSADKLLGGPQAGIIVGKRELIMKIKKNPMKRALRLDKITIAALAAVLRLYGDPKSLPQALPTLRLLTRERTEIRATVERLLASVAAAVGPDYEVCCAEVLSQIGSGSQPVERLPSAAIRIAPKANKGVAKRLQKLSSAFRGLARPVIGRIVDDALVFDCRCLESTDDFAAQLSSLDLS
ncbi:MAG: L-seryl-tRNA(Sec) selenium transferase [Pseudomonadota bacterium]